MEGTAISIAVNELEGGRTKIIHIEKNSRRTTTTLWKTPEYFT